MEAALAQDDKLLKTVLQPHFSGMENASITRETKDGRLTVTIEFLTKSYQEAQGMLDKTVLLDALVEANPGEILSEMISLWNTGKIYQT